LLKEEKRWEKSAEQLPEEAGSYLTVRPWMDGGCSKKKNLLQNACN
jgi:hypothetical protein